MVIDVSASVARAGMLLAYSQLQVLRIRFRSQESSV